MEEYEYESVRFPYAMKDYSQVVIYERSLDYIMSYDTRFCYSRARKFFEERLSKIDLLYWRAGIQNQESLRLVPNRGPYCWLKTNIFITLEHQANF
jgi:hypothetical protein